MRLSRAAAVDTAAIAAATAAAAAVQTAFLVSGYLFYGNITLVYIYILLRSIYLILYMYCCYRP